VTIAIPLHLHAVQRAKAVEATEILSEVARLEYLGYMEQGTYTARPEVDSAIYGRGTQAQKKNGHFFSSAAKTGRRPVSREQGEALMSLFRGV
jgi:hypothetical protein